MNTHTDTEAHDSFSGIFNFDEYFPFLRKISRNFLENFLRNIFPEKQHHYFPVCSDKLATVVMAGADTVLQIETRRMSQLSSQK